MNSEVHMHVSWPLPAVGCLLSLVVAACHRPAPEAAITPLDPACAVAVAADARGDRATSSLQEDLRAGRSPARAAEHLGYRFIAQARLTNDPGYYKVAEQAAVCLETLQANSPAALLLRGHALHQMHRFAEAETMARRLVAQREFALDFGLLGDALMEQGRLAEAGEAYQKMIDLRPFYQSYTRAAHLRWLRGDLDGATLLMQQAVRAASPRDPESVAWAYARLGSYAIQAGRLTDAMGAVDASLQFVPDYAAALLVRGRTLLAQKKDEEAAGVLARAARLNPLPEYQWVLADVLRRLDRGDEARAVESKIVLEGAASDPRTLALFLSTRRMDGERAVELARRELATRRDIFTLDAMAWALASAGRVEEASTLMATALAEGTEDGRLFVHAAVIAAAAGRMADADRWARKARTLRLSLLPSELELLARVRRTPPA
jgi:tetratricopeptide (TPR) repeat protein